MNILISNDDGYDALGIITLKKHLDSFADVTLVAPSEEKSASSRSITIKNPLKLEKKRTNEFAISGTPTDCVKFALLNILKDNKPDLIISGINNGGNIGDDVIYSGTVAAAMEGTTYDVPSIAVSLVTKFIISKDKPEDEILYFDTAGEFIVQFVKNLDINKFPKKTLLNINVPNVPYNKLEGISFSSLGKRTYDESYKAKIDPDGRVMHVFTTSGRTFHRLKDTDSQAIMENKISITPLQLDLTNYDYLREMKSSWNLKL